MIDAAEPSTEAVNKRSMKRMRALKGARYLVSSLTGSGIDCTIIDIHSQGARVRFTDPIAVKEDVEFILFPENVRVTGKRTWQRGREFGVKFDHPLAWLEKHDRMLRA